MSNLETIFTDLIDNGGIQYKMLLNDIMSERKELALRGGTFDPSSIDIFEKNPSKDLPAKVDSKELSMNDVESLISKMEAARNRKEKRRLLAEYNQR